MQNMLQRLKGWVERMHHDEGGAIVMLGLAGVMILFMTALVMYDAGEGAREKAEVQLASDTAALSHATTKARAMNMVAYANTTKRILYGYNVIYVSAYLALIETTGLYYALAAKHTALAARPWCAITVVCPLMHLASAADNLVHALMGTIQLTMETIEAMFNNGPALMGLGVGGDTFRSVKEMAAMDFYQEYTSKISGWWSWGEATTRGIRNRATLIGTWPPPPGSFVRVRNFANGVMSAINTLGIGSISSPFSSRQDELPIEREPSTPLSIASNLLGHTNMCFQTLTSLDFWAMQYYFQHHSKSKGYWKDNSGPYKAPFGRYPSPKSLVTGLTIAQMPIGCLIAAVTFSNHGMPFEISYAASRSLPNLDATEDWVFATSNYAFGYKKGNGRFSEDAKAAKYQYMQTDYGLQGGGAQEMLYRNDGYWSVSRAEIVYARSFVGEALSGPSGGSPPSGSKGRSLLSGLGTLVSSYLDAPNMWSPRYTSRLRPVNLVGEEIESMNTMAVETIPYMVFAAPISFAYGDGGDFSGMSLPSGSGIFNAAQDFALDAFFFWRAGAGFSKGRMSSGAMPK